MQTTNKSFVNTNIFIVLLLIFTFAPSSIYSQDDTTECPYFNITSGDTIGVSFSLLKTDINATISGVIANVVVEQTYINSGDSIVDASYIFPMSSNAAIYAMEMQINDRTIKAEIKRKAEAQTIFDNANNDGLTASLLEQERPNVFQMSLANINPSDTIKIRMVYTELLIPKKGVYQFIFPNIVGPRFTSNGESWVSQSSNALPSVAETELNINLKINAGMAVQAECKSHNVNFNNFGNSTQTLLSTNPGDDFIVDYTLDNNQIETGLLLYEGEEENFFLSMIQPAKPDLPFESPNREYIFIMDVSGSMRGEPIEISKELITSLLNNLTVDDKFNIIFFAGSSTVMSPNSINVTGENINMAIEMIDNISAGGGTVLLPAMQKALDMNVSEDYSRTFVILTDGFVTVEKETFDLIRNNLGEANFFSFGIGTAINHFIIDGIAYVGEGEAFTVTDSDDASESAETFREYIERPVLTNIKTSFFGIDAYEVEPLNIPDVFAERPIIMYGKYNKPAQGDIVITGDYAEGQIVSSLSFSDYSANSDENIALKYLWARKKIKLMSDYGIASNESDTISIEEEITQLGLKYSLVTEFTSFVAVDTSAVTNVDDEGDDDGSGDGSLVEVNEIDADDVSSKVEIIKIIGNLTNSKSELLIKLENLKASEYKDLVLQITDINGYLISSKDLNSSDLDNIISIALNQIPSGFYLVSLISNNKILDSEKFVIAN